MFLNPLFLAEKVKRDLDSSFGAPWHVVVGESFDFNIDFDFHYLYYLLYGPVAILAWRVSKRLKFAALKPIQNVNLYRNKTGIGPVS